MSFEVMIFITEAAAAKPLKIFSTTVIPWQTL